MKNKGLLFFLLLSVAWTQTVQAACFELANVIEDNSPEALFDSRGRELGSLARDYPLQFNELAAAIDSMRTPLRNVLSAQEAIQRNLGLVDLIDWMANTLPTDHIITRRLRRMAQILRITDVAELVRIADESKNLPVGRILQSFVVGQLNEIRTLAKFSNMYSHEISAEQLRAELVFDMMDSEYASRVREVAASPEFAMENFGILPERNSRRRSLRDHIIEKPKALLNNSWDGMGESHSGETFLLEIKTSHLGDIRDRKVQNALRQMYRRSLFLKATGIEVKRVLFVEGGIAPSVAVYFARQGITIHGLLTPRGIRKTRTRPEEILSMHSLGN